MRLYGTAEIVTSLYERIMVSEMMIGQVVLKLPGVLAWLKTITAENKALLEDLSGFFSGAC